jgi:NADH:ubiquinone oxidoreductase subunit 3 (subunit A)
MPPTPVPTPAGLDPAFDLVAYYPALIYAVVIIGVGVLILAGTHVPFLKPRRPSRVKQMPYESGMDPVGTARMQFDVKFYLIAILFLVFDVELLFLYPWAVTAYADDGNQDWQRQFGTIVFVEILIFLATLAIAYVYAWRKGVFQWR